MSMYLGAWLMKGCGLYLGKLYDLNSSIDEIPGQLSSVGVPIITILNINVALINI